MGRAEGRLDNVNKNGPVFVNLISVRSSLDNPFTPGADTVPEVWAGRLPQLQDWEGVLRPRRMAGLPERGRTILGEAGLGKSTLVRRIAATARQRGDWVTPQLRIPLGADPLKAVAGAVLTLADQAGLAASRDRRIGALLDRVRQVSVSGVGLTVDRSAGPEPYAALSALLVEVGAAALAHDVAVVIHVDEVQNITHEDTLSQLLICLGDALAHEQTITAPGGVEVTRVLPLVVYLTGLPDFADMAGARKGATFARRFHSTTLAPLSDDDLAMALRPFVLDGWPVPEGRVWMTGEAADEIVGRCHGEPFLFQLAGERAWYAGAGEVITADDVRRGWEAARHEAAAHVERILNRLPAREMQMLQVMAVLAPEERSLTTIARQMGYATVAQAGPVAQRLDTIRGIVDRGRPYAFRHRAIEAYLTSSWPSA